MVIQKSAQHCLKHTRSSITTILFNMSKYSLPIFLPLFPNQLYFSEHNRYSQELCSTDWPNDHCSPYCIAVQLWSKKNDPYTQMWMTLAISTCTLSCRHRISISVSSHWFLHILIPHLFQLKHPVPKYSWEIIFNQNLCMM